MQSYFYFIQVSPSCSFLEFHSKIQIFLKGVWNWRVSWTEGFLVLNFFFFDIFEDTEVWLTYARWRQRAKTSSFYGAEYLSGLCPFIFRRASFQIKEGNAIYFRKCSFLSFVTWSLFVWRYLLGSMIRLILRSSLRIALPWGNARWA